MGKQQTRNTANSYDQNFDDTLRYIIDPNYREQKNKQTESYTNYNRFRQEAFDLSKNKDFLDGSENPHTFQGGLDINSEDPFNELRASRQGGWSELGLFGGRAIAKTGREIINTAGAIGGLAPAIAGQLEDAYTGEDKTTFLQTVFDNAFIKANNEMFDKLNKEFLPVYVSDTVTNGGFTDKIFSGEFWATEGADGVGYLVSMLAPGAALKSLKVGNGIFNTAAKLTALKNGKSIATAQRALEMAGWSGQKVDSFIIPAFNTLAEAGAEARGFSDNLRANKTEALANIFNSEEFRNTKNSKLQELGQQYMSKSITQEEYESRVNNLDFEISEKMFEDQVSSGMTNTFLKNVVALAGPNYIQSKILYGNNGARNLLNQVTKKPVTQGLKRVGQAFLSEGSEEVAQTAIEHRNLEMGKKGLLGKSIVDDYNPITFGEDFIKTLGTTEGQVAGFLGGVLGSPISVIGGYIQDKKDIVRDKSARDKILLAGTSLNDIHLPIYETEIVYNYNNEPTEVRKKDENGNDILIPENVAKVKKALDFHEELSQVFDVAVEAGNTEIVNKLKEIGEQNLMMNFVGEDEMTIDAFKEHLKVTLPTENVEKSVAEENLKRQHDLLEKAKHVRKEMISFNNMVPKFIKLNNETATENQTKSFMNDLQRSFINDSVELRELEKKKSELESENADLEKFTKVEELDNPNYVEGKSHELDKKITKRTNPRLDKNNEELEKINKQIENNKKFINEEIWDNDFINKRFEEFLKEVKKIEKETSPEVVENNNAVLEQIRNLNSTEELMNFNKNLDDSLKNNPVILDALEDRAKEVIQENKLKEELLQQEKLNKDKETFQEDADFGTNTINTTTVTASETNIINGLETIQTSDNPEVTNNDEIFDESPLNIVTLKENTNPENSDKNQGSARIISTYEETGEAIPGLESFVEFEKIPRDKTKDKVTFSLGDITKQKQDEELELIFNKVKKGLAVTQEEIIALENYLPIKVTLTNGKNSASSFIDSMSHPNPDIVARETLPLRRAIVASLIENKGDFKGIEGKVEKQFSGTLKLGEQNSNILELDVFKGMSQEDMIKYFKKNTVYVSNKGVVKYTATDAIDDTKSLSSKNKGEVFLKIPMINGEIFYLKLNVSRLTDEKAKDTFELIKLRSNVLNKKEEFTFEQLEEYIQIYLPSLRTEFDFIKRNTDSIDVTLERLINFIVYSQNTNAKTKLILGQDGTLVLGELLHKVNAQIPEWSGQLESYTYTIETLNNLTEEQEQAIIEYLKYKRHNVLITKDNDFTFNNDDYIKYLLGLNSDYSILSTNAVVNEPTFQGYSNIYLNQSVVNNNKSKPKEIPSEEIKSEDINYENPEDLLASLENQYGDDVVVNKSTTTSKPQQSDIESKKVNKEQELKSLELGSDGRIISDSSEFEATVVSADDVHKVTVSLKSDTSSGFKFSKALSGEFKTREEAMGFFNSVVKPRLIDKINAKYDAELAALEGKSTVSTSSNSNMKGNLTQQGTSVELEIKGDTGKEFLLTVDRKGNINLFSEKQSDGSYKAGEIAPKEAVDKLYNKYVSEKTRRAITNWLNSFTGSWAAPETQDGKNYTKAEKELNKELAALESKSKIDLKALKDADKALSEALKKVQSTNSNQQSSNQDKKAAILKGINNSEFDKNTPTEDQLQELINYINPEGKITPSTFQRVFKFGYNKAERITNIINKELKTLESENNLENKVIKSNNLQDIFKNADIKTKSKIVAVTAKQLGMMDKVNPKDMESSFNELFKELKDNESLQNEIKKICGI